MERRSSREEQRRWLTKIDNMKQSVRSLVEEARSGGHDPVPEAVLDMLDELKAELLEDFQSSRRETRGEAIRTFPPSSGPWPCSRSGPCDGSLPRWNGTPRATEF